MDITDHDYAILNLSNDDWNGQGRSFQDEVEASMGALVIMLGASAVAALGAVALIAWAVLSR